MHGILSNHIVTFVHNNGRVEVKVIRFNGKSTLTLLGGFEAIYNISLLSCFTVLFS